MDPTTAQHIREAFYAAICFTIAVVTLFYLSHRSTDHGPTNWAKWKAFFAARHAERQPVMSHKHELEAPSKPVAPPVARGATTVGQPIATTDNEDNDQLSDIELLSEEVRDIIRFQAKVELLANLYNSGQITNLAKGIEDSFNCSRSSKEESTYQKVRRVLDPLIAKQPEPTPIAGRPSSAKFASDLS